VKFVTAASETIAAAMERDPRIVVLGEDVHQMRGGVSGFTKGALEKLAGPRPADADCGERLHRCRASARR
jgi:pyruvate/2-oxoglutarate/acetoin dehydrogenase E1 component